MVIRSSDVDLGFLKELSSLGGESVGICIQCGTCTATCPLSNAMKGFPRKTIRHVQLGLRDRALGDIDMWLCASCRTCNASCPRGASPGEVMSALTRYASAQYSPLGLGRWLLRLELSSYLMLGLIVAVILVAIGLVANPQPGSMDLQGFLPFKYIDLAGVVVGLMVLAGLAVGGWKMWKATQNDVAIKFAGHMLPAAIKAAFKTIIEEMILQKSLRRCESNIYGAASHLLLVIGFVGAALTTTIIFVTAPNAGPPPLLSPLKVLGNASAVLMIAGSAMMLGSRFTKRGKEYRYYFYDWLFLALVLSSSLTGLLTEALRLYGVSASGYVVYSLHLVLITLMLVLAPYTKFVHAFYRLIASWVGSIKGWKEVPERYLEV